MLFCFVISACTRGKEIFVPGLKESDAYPAEPEDGYGWEKLFSERMCRHFTEDFGLETRVVRYHNVYGPLGTYDGGREKAPAALCRKIINAKINNIKSIDVWGDGKQTRSFMYIDDLVKGLILLMNSDNNFVDPINLGNPNEITINKLASIINDHTNSNSKVIFQELPKDDPKRRKPDIFLANKILGWHPSVKLKEGLLKTIKYFEKI